jgi:hemolysin D
MKIPWLRRDDSHEFKPTLAEIEETPTHPLGRAIFWIVVSTMVFFAVWFCVGKVDVVVTARGTVIPEGEVKTVQPLDTGVVSGILCKEGDLVKRSEKVCSSWSLSSTGSTLLSGKGPFLRI